MNWFNASSSRRQAVARRLRFATSSGRAGSRSVSPGASTLACVLVRAQQLVYRDRSAGNDGSVGSWKLALYASIDGDHRWPSAE
jgi:hypothetical protein